MDKETLDTIIQIIEKRKDILRIDIKHADNKVDELRDIARVNELNLLEIELLKMRIKLL